MNNPPITGDNELDSYLYNVHLALQDQDVGSNIPVDPTSGNPVTYPYQYISIKYADDNVGGGFSNTPTYKSYWGIHNSSSSVESTNPADYTWYATTAGFGTAIFVYFLCTGARTIKFYVDTTPPSYKWIKEPGTSIDLDSLVAAGTISYNEIMDATINELKLADAAVTAAKTNIAALNQATGGLNPSTVSAAQIINGAVTELKLLDGAVTNTKILAGTITGDRIAANTIGANQIAANAITANKIEAGAVTADKILAGSVTAAKISVGNLAAINANLGAITAGSLSAVSISGSTITGGSISITNGGNTVLSVSSSGSPVLNYRAASGYNITASNLYDPGSAVYKGTTVSTSAASAVEGIGNSSGHGVRGENTSYGALGFVGSSLGGGYDFYSYGSGGTYGSFTGSHDCLLALDHDVEVGDIVYDFQMIGRRGYSNTITEVKSTTIPNQKAAIGVLIQISDLINEANCPAAFKETFSITDDEGNVISTTEYTLGDAENNYYWAVMNSMGEGQINVCGENGNIEAGDLIVSSSIKGKGMKQADDIIRSYTVAKSRETVTFDSPTQVKQIACIYLAG